MFQVRFFLAYLRGKFKVSKENMIKDITRYDEISKTLGQTIDHDLEKNHRAYVEDLAVTANIKGIPPVINKLYDYVLNEKFQVFNLAYKVVNDEEFDCYKCLC